MRFFFCPEKYNDDLENDLICNLWIDLQVMKFEIEISETTTMAPQNNVTCEFAQHPTSFHSLCEVWCQIQELHGDQCIYCLSELMEAYKGSECAKTTTGATITNIPSVPITVHKSARGRASLHSLDNTFRVRKQSWCSSAEWFWFPSCSL